MKTSDSLTRRQLLTVLPISAGCQGCFGASTCKAQNAAAPTLNAGEKADMTWHEIFEFAYGQSIPVLTKIAGQVGQTQFVKMAMKASEAAAAEEVARQKIPPEKRDLAAWIAPIKNAPLLKHALAMDIVKDAPTEFAIKVTQCLWAKTFRDRGAGDIGYALICHPDDAAVAAFNPKLKLIRTKTLMQGADSCSLRYVVA